MSPSRALLAAVVAVQLAYPQAVRGRPRTVRDRATRGVVALMLAASVAETARGPRPASRGGAPRGRRRRSAFAAEVAGVATGRPFGPLPLRRRPRARAWPACRCWRRAAWTMMARPAWAVAGLLTRRPGAARGRRRRRADRLGRLPRPADGARRVLDLGAARALRGHPGLELRRAGWRRAPRCSRCGPRLDGDEDARDGSGDGALALYVWTWVGETVAQRRCSGGARASPRPGAWRWARSRSPPCARASAAGHEGRRRRRRRGRAGRRRAPGRRRARRHRARAGRRARREGRAPRAGAGGVPLRHRARRC